MAPATATSVLIHTCLCVEDPSRHEREIELHILVFDKSKRTGSQWTLRWREMDSNFRFRAKGATDLSFRFCLCP